MVDCKVFRLIDTYSLKYRINLIYIQLVYRELADRIGCFSLFATHFHELTMLSTHTSRIGNMRMATSIDGEQLTLLYKATPGAVDDSFGLNVARLVAFPPDVIEVGASMVISDEFCNCC
jgi:DNA mismatch repair ATPase MutS